MNTVLPKEGEVLVDDLGSPSGPRRDVPARLNGSGVEIWGEDDQWHVVKPEGLGMEIISSVLGLLGVSHLPG